MKPTLWAWVGLGLGTPEASTMENVYSYVSDNDQNTSPRQQKSLLNFSPTDRDVQRGGGARRA